MSRLSKVFLLGFIIAWLASCGKIDSDQVSPEAIYFSTNIHFDEELNGALNTVRCVTTPTHQTSGESRVVDLIDGDKLICNGVRMRRKDYLLGFTYEAIIPKSVQNNYVLTYYRNDKEFGSASISLPEDFTVLEPNNNFNMNYNDSMKVILEPKLEMGVVTKTELQIHQGFSIHSESKDNQTVIIPSFRETFPDSVTVQEGEAVILTVTRARSQTFTGKFKGEISAGFSKKIYGKTTAN